MVWHSFFVINQQDAKMHGIRPTHIHPGRRLEVSYPLRPTPNQRNPARESRFATGLTREEHRLHQAEQSRVDVDNQGRRFVGDAVNGTPNHTVARSLGIKHIRHDPLSDRSNAMGWSGGIAQAALHSSQWKALEIDRNNMTDVVSLRKRKATHMINPLREPDAELDMAERRPFKRTIHLDTWNKTAVRDTPANNEYTSAPALQTFAETAPLRSHDPSLSARFDEMRQRTTVQSTHRDDSGVRSATGYTSRHRMPLGTTGPPAVETFTNHDRGASNRSLQRGDDHREAVQSTTRAVHYNNASLPPAANPYHLSRRMAVVPVKHSGVDAVPFRASSTQPHSAAVPLSGAVPYQTGPRPIDSTPNTPSERRFTENVAAMGPNGFLLGGMPQRTGNPFAPVNLYRAATADEPGPRIGFPNPNRNCDAKGGTKIDTTPTPLAYHTDAITRIPIRHEGYQPAVPDHPAHSGHPIAPPGGHQRSGSTPTIVVPSVATSAANRDDFRSMPAAYGGAPVATGWQMRNASDSVLTRIDGPTQRSSHRSQLQRIQPPLSMSDPDGETVERRRHAPPTTTDRMHGAASSGYAVTVNLNQTRNHDDRSVARTAPLGVSFADGTKPGLGQADRVGPSVGVSLPHPSIATGGTPLSHANLLVRAMGDDAAVTPFDPRVRENWFRSSSAGDWLEGMGTKWKQPTGGLRPHW